MDLIDYYLKIKQPLAQSTLTHVDLLNKGFELISKTDQYHLYEKQFFVPEPYRIVIRMISKKDALSMEFPCPYFIAKQEKYNHPTVQNAYKDIETFHFQQHKNADSYVKAGVNSALFEQFYSLFQGGLS